MGAELSVAAVAALQQGNKIEAIRIVREERNIGLKEAKDAVDEYVSSKPALQASLAEAQKKATQGFLRWIAIIAAVLLVATYFIVKK